MRRPSTAVLEDWAQQGGRLPQICNECLRLRKILRDLHEEASTTEDAGDFILGILETFPGEIESWGEEAFESEHARVTREEAELKAEERAELARLISKYLPAEVVRLLKKYVSLDEEAEDNGDENQ